MDNIKRGEMFYINNVHLDELCLCCRPALIDEHSLDCLFYHLAMGLFLL